MSITPAYVDNYKNEIINGTFDPANKYYNTDLSVSYSKSFTSLITRIFGKLLSGILFNKVKSGYSFNKMTILQRIDETYLTLSIEDRIKHHEVFSKAMGNTLASFYKNENQRNMLASENGLDIRNPVTEARNPIIRKARLVQDMHGELIVRLPAIESYVPVPLYQSEPEASPSVPVRTKSFEPSIPNPSIEYAGSEIRDLGPVNDGEQVQTLRGKVSKYVSQAGDRITAAWRGFRYSAKESYQIN